MVHLNPFPALYYNPKKVNLPQVCVPPYDVISKEEKIKFFKKSPYNFSKIILGKDRTGYKAAAKRFWMWQKKNVLIKDQRSGFYIWEQSFLFCGKKVRRRGIVAAVRLKDFFKRQIRPHEKTFAVPKSDRMKILKATRANLTPVFMMYDDPQRKLERTVFRHLESPVILSPNTRVWQGKGSLKDNFGVAHRIWRISDSRSIWLIQKIFRKKHLYIVDGHHRFATALKYFRSNPSKASSAVMSFVTNLCDPGLVLYSIDRFLPYDANFSKETYLKTLKKEFRVQKIKKYTEPGFRKWVVYFQKDGYVLKPKNIKHLMSSISEKQVLKDLDVYLLHQKIIPKKIQSKIRYLRGMPDFRKKLLKDLNRGKISAVWMCSPPTLKQLKAVCDAKEVMPAKSTYFYPKLLSGLLIRVFD